MILTTMQQPAIVFLDVDTEDEKIVQQRFPSVRFVDATLRGGALVKACRDAGVISCFINTPFPREVLEQLPKLKLLCTRSVGFDHIDLEVCRERDIVVTNVPDYGAHVIAEHVFALLLSLMRHIPEGHQRVLGGSFDYHLLKGIALCGKTIGIVGTGKIGQRVARIAHGFDMKILAEDIHQDAVLTKTYGVHYVPRARLFAESDIISLHVPALPDTVLMLNKDTFAQMKDGVIIVNTARGTIIDSSDLVEALDARKVRFALLDVLSNEANLEDEAALIRHPRVIVTPHIAFYADDSVKAMLAETFRSIEEWQAGKTPEHAVAAKK